MLNAVVGFTLLYFRSCFNVLSPLTNPPPPPPPPPTSTATGTTDALTVGSVTSVGIDVNVLNMLDDAFQAVLTFAIPTNSLELDRVRNVTGTVRAGGSYMYECAKKLIKTPYYSPWFLAKI